MEDKNVCKHVIDAWEDNDREMEGQMQKQNIPFLTGKGGGASSGTQNCLGMGTKVQSKSYLPGYYSMRDLNDDSNSCSWPNYFGDKSLTNGQYYPIVAADTYQGYDRDILKQVMLEHEATFKYQVYELHRLYRIQRDLMDEMKKKELQKFRVPIETSLSSSPLASQSTSEDGQKWPSPSFPFANSALVRPSAASGVEDIHSSLSSMRGGGNQGSPFLSQKGASSKDVEVLESRPSKVRKMLDLQLPADAYIDTHEAEQLRGDNLSGVSLYLLNGNGKIIHENGKRLITSDCEKTGRAGVSLRSKSCLRTADGLADLNEPVQVEESSDFMCAGLLERQSFRGETQEHELPVKSNQDLLSFCQEISVNSHNQSNNSSMKTIHLEHRANANGLFSPAFDAGHGRSSFKSVSQVSHLDKLPGSSQSIQVLSDRAHEPPPFLVARQSKQDALTEKTCCAVDTYDRHHELTNNSHLESVVNSNMPRPQLVSSDITNSWPRSISSWDKPSCSLSQKSSSVQPLLFLDSAGTCNKSSPISAQNSGIFGEKLQHNNSRLPPGFGTELLNRNGFYYGSSSGTKEPVAFSPTVSHSYLSCSNDNGVASDHLTGHFATKFRNSSNATDMKSGSSLNVMISNSLSNDLRSQPGCDSKIGDRKQEDDISGLPWLRANPTSKNDSSSMRRNSTIENGFSHSSLRLSEGKNETGNGFSQMFTQNVKSVSCSNEVEGWKAGMNSSPCEKMIMGIPIFEQPSVPKNDSFSLTSSTSVPRPSEPTAEGNRKTRLFDINLPCDDAFPDASEGAVLETSVLEKKEDVKAESSRHEIDLNSCAHEDEASFAPTTPCIGTKVVGVIDLEALPAPEADDVILEEESGQKSCEAPILTSEQKNECPQDELVHIAAEAIVAISSLDTHVDQNADICQSSETSFTNPLQWFVDTVHDFGEDLERKLDSFVEDKLGGNQDEFSLEEIDDFEYMTLKLVETKEGDYMPTPLVPENLKLEETGRNPLSARTRKGQRRRGGQRRDFQRDILPGLVSLSRHEVTEDLQTFGGLMRATGYLWQSGPTRRNSTRNGARGRRRTISSTVPVQSVGTPAAPLIQQLSNIEVALEDRSLTGWGKTTRRPRRQRCPAGNPPAIALT